MSILKSRKLFLLLLSGMTVFALALFACSPSSNDAAPAQEPEAAAVDGGGASDAPESATASEPAASGAEAAHYDGDDPQQIITVLCAQPMCHEGDTDTILAYRNSATLAEVRVNTHAAVNCTLTDSQIEALKTYFTEQ